MDKHSPGPWPYSYTTPYSVWVGDTQIATTRWTDDSGVRRQECVQSDSEAAANARLFSASPELLNASHETVSALHEVYQIPSDADDNYIYDVLGSSLAAAYFSAREGIAKARGI